MTPAEEALHLLAALGVTVAGKMDSRSPIDGQPIGSVVASSIADVEAACAHAQDAFLEWRLVPAPKRGGSGRQSPGRRGESAVTGELHSGRLGCRRRA